MFRHRARGWGLLLRSAATAAASPATITSFYPFSREVSTDAINLKPGNIIDVGGHLRSILKSTHTQGRAGQRGHVQVGAHRLRGAHL